MWSPFRRVGAVVVSDALIDLIDDHVRAHHPEEAGGFLKCERRGGALYATDHVPLANRSTEPTRRFEATVDETAPRPPRVFYHSHTAATFPSGLSRLDERAIPEAYALVAFAPHGEVYSYRAFARRLTRWAELDCLKGVVPTADRRVTRTPLPQL